MRLKELSVELRHRIVSRHRSGEGYQNISAALKVPKNTVPSVILKWNKFGTTKTVPRDGSPAKLGIQGRRALVRESPDLNLIEHPWKDLKITVQQRGINVIFQFIIFNK
uniref:Sleeping Beauty transposase HTH domain-containing protein n=1 Tax=Oncorhynchus tshawytscha TaxID=74940 RepID=A0AAZ3S8A8_ONCTS